MDIFKGHLFCANCFHGNILYAHVPLAKSNVTINADCKIIILFVSWKWEYSYVIHNTQISDRNMVVMFIAKLLKYHLIYLCYFEILLKVNCSPFRSTRVHPGYLRDSCCSIFSFLCRILLIIVCLFVLFLLTILFSVFFNIQILITPFGIF